MEAKVRKLMSLFIFMMVSIGCLTAQGVIIKGVVVDADTNDPLPGCSVLEKGTSNGTITSLDGKFSLTVASKATIIFSYIGYETQEVKSTQSEMKVRMISATSFLDESIVVAYATPARKLIGKVAESVSYERLECSLPGGYAVPPIYQFSEEEYNTFAENQFKRVVDDPLSTFSVDVDVASYSNIRRMVNNGQKPAIDAVRIEEMINYFSYDYVKPTGVAPVALSGEIGPCPWNEKHRLVRVGVKAKEIADDKLPASNLVFLIDVSGSMWGPTRLDLVKSSLKLLVNNLREKDKVSIVVYAGAAGEVLPVTSGSDKQKIREALDMLTAGGSTAGGAGINLAYKIAEKNFIKDGNNRIILCTDGDFNVGVSSKDGLEKLIEDKRKSGVFLTVLGYGMGNYKDDRMQILAEKGNGNYAYIDNLQEANKVLVTEFGGTIHTVAKDVKLQVEFNPAHGQAYRLVGYESRMLNHQDFNDDTKDAGEMGAGHMVTAFYEVVPVGVESSFAGNIDKLKYQKEKPVNNNNLLSSPELLTVKLRYKDPNGSDSKKIELPLVDTKGKKTTEDFRFAAAVAMFGQLLRNSDFKGDASYEDVIKLADSARSIDKLGYRSEFIRLVDTVKNMTE